MADVTGPAARRALAVICCAAVGAAAAGCSSSPAPSAEAQAKTARAAVLAAATQLYKQTTGAGIVQIGAIVAGYTSCGLDDPLAKGNGSSSVQYTASEDVYPAALGPSSALSSKQVLQMFDAMGWNLRSRGNEASTTATYHTGQRDGFHLWLIEARGQSGRGLPAYLYLSGSCFDAGASARQLIVTSPDEDIAEPSPAATPTPEHS